MPLAHLLRSRRAIAKKPLRCPSILINASPPPPIRSEPLQCAVFTSCTSSRNPGRPTLKSPLQWSHVLRLVRQPASAPMDLMPDPRAGLAQARAHAGHSHGHHHHDNTYLTSKNKDDPGVRITKLGLYVNLGMAIAKGAGGVIFNSQA